MTPSSVSRIGLHDASPYKLNRTLHELKVHQIELELQNEELRRAKAEADEVKARYQDLYDLAPVGYCTVNAAGLISQANQTLTTLLGVTHKALLGKPLSRYVSREDQDGYYLFRKQVLSPPAKPGTVGEPPTCELPMLRADGTPFWVQWTASSELDAQGAPELRLVVHDIRARRLADEALLASEERYRALAQDMPLFVCAFMPDGTLTYANAALAALIGMPAQNLIGQNFTDFLSASDRPMVTTRLAALTPAQDVETHEQSFWGTDGKEYTHQWTNRAFFDSAGRMTRLQAVGQDISVRKQLEQSLRNANQSLKESQVIAGLGTYAHHFPSGYWESSDVLDDLFGIDAGYLRSTEGWLALVHPDDRLAMEHYLATEVVAQRKPFDREYRIVRIRDTAERWVHGLGKLVCDDQGQVLRLQGTIQDITERKQAEAKLQLAGSVFSHAREGIMITRPDGTIMDVNETFTRITGYARDEVLGQSPRMLNSGRHGADFYTGMWQSLSAQGYWSGEIWNRRKNGEVFAEIQTISAVHDSQGTLQHYVALFSDITVQKEHQSQLEHIAHFDALTNLPNRVLLADRLHQAVAQSTRRGDTVAVAYLDLDGFKSVNDRYGHDVGDQLLIALANHMKDSLRDGDTMARIGGDEFVAVFTDLTHPQASLPLLTRLLEAAAQPVLVGDITVQVSASLGVTFYPQAQEIEADQLLRQADQAMYQAKLAGRNRYHVFDALQDTDLRVHHEDLQQIERALARHEFVLHYQPKVNMRSGQVIGVEALIRWQHPEKGLLAPAAFLPVIEEHPLAIAIGEWVIDTALHQVEQWRDAGLDLSVSVNIGARQLQQADFVERLQAILAQHPLVLPSCLELEILETSAVKDMAQVSSVIDACQQMGIAFALDDFGTGYSSLTYLKRLHVKQLKIDQSFVHGMLQDAEDRSILQGVIGLANAFQREVIAEGVETTAHGTALLQMGCDLAQGYGIARPMPADQLPTWVAAWQPDAAWRK
jgi:diguanylate cyclase (GGDEF)-like protein/PAS domain S-box-containing protein